MAQDPPHRSGLPATGSTGSPHRLQQAWPQNTAQEYLVSQVPKQLEPSTAPPCSIMCLEQTLVGLAQVSMQQIPESLNQPGPPSRHGPALPFTYIPTRLSSLPSINTVLPPLWMTPIHTCDRKRNQAWPSTSIPPPPKTIACTV
jgi:hypothetical protein